MKASSTFFRRAFISAICCLVLCAIAASAGTKPATEKFENIEQKMRAALKNCESQALANFFTSDAQMFGPGISLSGREAIEKHMASVCKVVKNFRIENQEYFESGDGTVETAKIIYLAEAGTPISSANYMTYWKNVSGEWLIHRSIAVPTTAETAKAPSTSLPFEIKERRAAVAVVLPMKGSFAQIGPTISRVVEYLQKSSIQPHSEPFGRFFNSPDQVSEANLSWEVGFFVAPTTTTVTAPFELRKIPGGTVADAIVSGPHEDANRPWPQLVSWTMEQGYSPENGPAMEIWMDGPKTEMILPVAKNK